MKETKFTVFNSDIVKIEKEKWFKIEKILDRKYMKEKPKYL